MHSTLLISVKTPFAFTLPLFTYSVQIESSNVQIFTLEKSSFKRKKSDDFGN
jgi:hypothetical protein